jgi:hypothetical protein
MEQTIEQAILMVVTLLVIVPLLIVVFIGLVFLIRAELEAGKRRRDRDEKSVQALINEVSGYGNPQPDPVEARLRQFVKEEQQEVEEEAISILDDLLTIRKERKTNHR